MTPITLRPYQEDCLNSIRVHFQALARRVILCAPTGAGKTVMFSSLTQQTLAKRIENKVLILTNRIELLTQAGGTLAAFGIRFEQITADNKRINPRARCYVGMIETYFKRIDKMPWLLDMTLVIIDECHYGNFAKLFARFKPSTFVIGATATPLSASKSDPLSNYYQALVNQVQIADLIAAGYLSTPITYGAKIDRSKLQRDKTGDYSDESQMSVFGGRQVYTGLLQRYQEACAKYNDGHPMKTIIFNVNVAHSLEVTQMFNDAGIGARHVDGTTDSHKRDRILKGYKQGEYPVICNVGILNAGFDDPTTRCIIMNRATTSVSLWLQSCGRGSRVAPGKPNFIILDMGDNWTELGLWEAERDWGSIWNQTRKKSDKVDVAPAKVCDACDAIVPLSSRQCPKCGYEFPQKEKTYAEAEEFVEVTPDMVPQPKFSPERVKELIRLNRPDTIPSLPVETLLEIQEVKGYKAGWLLYKINDRCQSEEEFLEQIQQVAQLKGYKRGWVMRQQWNPPVNAQLV
ncbi:superfamily II DNA or RNA helicase [Spirosoma lacussanchae]|uniref:DEAD/DEAH box helicase n=1 Tax=Spirosoma lacussanchae TaxID=1884249 RepID=UPI001109D539|nr:DEAD/DEAH box helicase [Spirosoma lacussanchae]